MKLLRGELEIPRSTRRSIKAVKIGFLIVRILDKNSPEPEFFWKDPDEKNTHFHFFPKKTRVGLVVTDETKTYPHPERHIHVDNEKFLEVFGRELDSYFKNRQEILDMNTSRFDKCRIITYDPQVKGGDVKKKILQFTLEENEKEISVEEFKKMKNVLSIIINEQGNVDEFVIKKDEKIHCFDYKAIQKISLELFPILSTDYKGSDEGYDA